MRNPEGPPADSRTADSRTAKGRAAEDTACRWLEARGWTVVARNWRRGPGELDAVARKGDELAFVEVKCVDAFGPESLARAVGPCKRRRIVETAKLFVSAHRELERMAMRFDVVAVVAGTVVGHLERAFAERA